MSITLVLVLLAFLLALVHASVLEDWQRAILREGKAGQETPQGPSPTVSMVVPARDAVATLTPLLQDLHAQRYPKERCEVFVVDDGSTDGTAALVQGMMHRWPQLRLVVLDGEQGKKAAIAKGVAEAKGDIVLITDADARCGPGRVARLAEHWARESPDLVLMPVHTAGGSGLAAWLQRKEQAALQGALMGSGLSGSPVLASGTNMAFGRSAFHDVGGYKGDRWASGDDMFLLQRMRRSRRKVSVLAHPDAVVRVAPEPGWGGFLAQRLRWAGKMRAYRDLPGLATALGALLFPWALAVLSAWVLGNVRIGQGLFDHALPLIGAWALWLLPILRLVRATEDHFMRAGNAPSGPPMPPDRGRGQLLALPAVFAFLLYAPVIAVLSTFVRPKWKGRRA